MKWFKITMVDFFLDETHIVEMGKKFNCKVMLMSKRKEKFIFKIGATQKNFEKLFNAIEKRQNPDYPKEFTDILESLQKAS